MARRLPEDHVQEEVVVQSPEVQPTATAGLESEETARLAHQHWLERGCPIGTPEEDWFRAEEEIKLRRQRLEQEGNDR